MTVDCTCCPDILEILCYADHLVNCCTEYVSNKRAAKVKRYCQTQLKCVPKLCSLLILTVFITNIMYRLGCMVVHFLVRRPILAGHITRVRNVLRKYVWKNNGRNALLIKHHGMMMHLVCTSIKPDHFNAYFHIVITV